MPKPILNKTLLRRLISHLHEIDECHFDMEDFGSLEMYGTVACISGHTILIASPTLFGSIGDVAKIARNHLGLTKSQAGALFTPRYVDYSFITKEHAILTLKELLKTGKVRWKSLEKNFNESSRAETPAAKKYLRALCVTGI